MSEKTKTPNAEALKQLHVAVERVTTICGRVLAKFPQSRVAYPLSLLGNPHKVVSIRRSSSGNEVVLLALAPFGNSFTTIRFPLFLLDAQESQIAKWTRARFWGDIYEAQRLAAQNEENIRKHAEGAVIRAEADLVTAKQKLEALTKLPAPKRAAKQARAKQHAERATTA